MPHKQKMIKVNTYVDEGIADLIETLNCFKKLRTIESCEGQRRATIIFTYGQGKWNTMASFIFKFLAPKLIRGFGNKIDLSMRMNSFKKLQGELLVERSALPAFTNYLKKIVALNTEY